MLDPFSNRTPDLIIRPVTGTGLRIRREIRSRQTSRKSRKQQRLSCEFHVPDFRSTVLRPVRLRMAVFAPQQSLHQILAPRQPLRRPLELAVSRLPHSGSNKRAPSDRESNGNCQQHAECTHGIKQNFPKFSQWKSPRSTRRTSTAFRSSRSPDHTSNPKKSRLRFGERSCSRAHARSSSGHYGSEKTSAEVRRQSRVTSKCVNCRESRDAQKIPNCRGAIGRSREAAKERSPRRKPWTIC